MMASKQTTGRITSQSDYLVPKALTGNIVAKIVSSPKLKSELVKFLEEEISIIHRNEANWKIYVLSKKWQKILSHKTKNTFGDMLTYIEDDRRFKLPWTSTEVEIAIASANILINVNKNE
jgi:hypothetical protein